MWVFGHLGIGSKLVAPMARRLPYGWLLFGAILPDLIDKPLYYAMSIATGRTGAGIGLISCTRTIGHTALFALGLAALATWRKSRVLAALSLGVASHLALDGFQDYWAHRVQGVPGESSLVLAALFPFFEARFGIQPFPSFSEHLKSGGRPLLLLTEGIGIAILAWDYSKRRWRPKRPLRNELL